MSFLLRCAGARAELPAEGLERLSRDVTDWSRLVELATVHAIVPLLSLQATNARPGLLPEDTVDELQEAVRRGAIRGLQLAGHLVIVLAELRRRGIDAIPVKGPTLAALVYGNFSLRWYEDLDVLVHPDDFESAKEALHDLDFYPVQRVFNDSRDALLPEDHQEAFVHRESTVPLELHRSLSHRTLADDSLERRWWKERQTIVVAGLAMETLGPETLLLHLCMHGAKHSWSRLVWLCDLHHALQRFDDANWEVIWRLADECGATRMVNVGLLLVNELLGGSEFTQRAFDLRPADNRSLSIAVEIRDRILCTPGAVPEIDFGVQMRLRTRWRDRVRYAIHILAEPWPADVAALELPQTLRRAYYVFRPLRLAWKYFSGRRDAA